MFQTASVYTSSAYSPALPLVLLDNLDKTNNMMIKVSGMLDSKKLNKKKKTTGVKNDGFIIDQTVR